MKYTLINSMITADITYRRGKLAVVEVKKGTFDFELLGMLIPAQEKHVDTRDMLPHEKKTHSSFYTPAREAWMSFYEKRTGVTYRFMAADGNALVQIGQSLEAWSPGNSVELWNQMLTNWDKLEDFYRNNMDIRFINGQLNKIINQLKNGKQTGNTAANNVAGDLRRSL